MFVVFFRTLIIYFVIIVCLRIMGKRQLGELQPSEFVIAILISNIATLSIEDTDIPLIGAVVPIITLMSAEVILSFITLKSGKAQVLVSGNPVMIIRDGKIDQKSMRDLRFSIEDLMSQLRINGIFDIQEEIIMSDALVFQSDFGLVDGAVAAMYGVALDVDKDLKIFNLTHDITPYNIWEASYRLYQSVEYWPKGTVIVSVVDPGVGSSRKSVVAKTSQGQFIVTPDNGTLTHIKKNIGIVSIREIDESRHRRQNTEFSYTFHGRDVYANTGAKLASGKISFEEVGPELPIEKILELPCGEVVVEEKSVSGCIDILDVRFGSLWTNVPREDFKKIGAEFGDRIEVTIYNNAMLVYQNYIMYGHSFADVRIGEPIIYVNSLYRMAVAINQGSFAKAYNIGTGNHWKIVFRKISD